MISRLIHLIQLILSEGTWVISWIKLIPVKNAWVVIRIGPFFLESYLNRVSNNIFYEKKQADIQVELVLNGILNANKVNSISRNY